MMRPRQPVMLVNDHKRALKTTKPSTEDAFNTDEVIRKYDQERALSLRHRRELSQTHLKGDATTSRDSKSRMIVLHCVTFMEPGHRIPFLISPS